MAELKKKREYKGMEADSNENDNTKRRKEKLVTPFSLVRVGPKGEQKDYKTLVETILPKRETCVL